MKYAKTLLGGAVAGLSLLVLATSPTLANNHKQTAIPNRVSSAINEAQLTQKQTSQITTPRNQTTQQTKQTGCSCCQSMMNQKNNMPGMMGGQNNPSR